MKKALMLVGTYPPSRGGIGHYTERLVNALQERNWQVLPMVSIKHQQKQPNNVIYLQSANFFGFFSMFNIIKHLKQQKDEYSILNLQYPSAFFYTHGFLVIILLIARFFFKYRIIVTLHEFSRSINFRKLYSYLLVLLAHITIVTTKAERIALMNFKIPLNIKLIPLSANVIPIKQSIKKDPKCLYLSTFALIYPSRQLEKVVKIALQIHKLKLRTRTKLYLIGSPHPAPNFQKYYEKIKQLVIKTNKKHQKTGLTVEIKSDLTDKQVSYYIQKTDIGILFNKGGLTYKSGTLLTYLAHKKIILSNKIASNDPDLHASITSLNNISKDFFKKIMLSPNNKGALLVSSWDSIAKKYIKTFE